MENVVERWTPLDYTRAILLLVRPGEALTVPQMAERLNRHPHTVRRALRYQRAIGVVDFVERQRRQLWFVLAAHNIPRIRERC